MNAFMYLIAIDVLKHKELTCIYDEFCPTAKENPIGVIHTVYERVPKTTMSAPQCNANRIILYEC